jgi:hypothetical protein
MACTVLYPTYRTVVACDSKAQTSCKRPLKLHVSIACHVQTFFNSPNRPDRICGLPCLLLKGCQELHPWGIRRRRWWGLNSWQLHLILMLKTSGDILPIPHIVRAQISRKIRTHLKILHVRVVTQSKTHIQDPQLVGASVKIHWQLRPRCTWFVHPCSKDVRVWGLIRYRSTLLVLPYSEIPLSN